MGWWRGRPGNRAPGGPVIASPNIWNWPDVYEIENHAQDAHDAVWRVIEGVAPWSGSDVVDVGCGAGFHLPKFAHEARSVIGVEPHEPLAERARARVTSLDNVMVMKGSAAHLPLEAASADIVHARTAYFFGPGCEPGIRESLRVLRPRGTLVIVDLDATAHPYGAWMRADLPKYRPDVVEEFFRKQGFALQRADTEWVFERREDLDEVLGIEFSPRIAARAREATSGLSITVRYRIHSLRREIAAL